MKNYESKSHNRETIQGRGGEKQLRPENKDAGTMKVAVNQSIESKAMF